MLNNSWLKLAAVSLAGVVVSFGILWGINSFSNPNMNMGTGYQNTQTYGENGYNMQGNMQGNMNNNMQGSMNGNMNGGMNGNMQGGMGGNMQGNMNNNMQGNMNSNMQGGMMDDDMMMGGMMGGMM